MQFSSNSIETAYEKLKDVWQNFMEKGVIDQSVLRPEIYDSWIRSYNQEQDYNVYSGPLLPLDIMLSKQQKNKTIMDIALPVMKDIYDMMESMSNTFAVVLFDDEGDVIQIINHDSDVRLGHRCSEIHGATNAPGLALKNGRLEEVCGYEHLYAVAHNWYSVARPIFNIEQNKAGVLGVLNFTSRLPAIKPMVLFGAQLIELSLSRAQHNNYNLSKFMEALGHASAIIDELGKIQSVNKRFVDLMGVPKETILNQSLRDFISGDIDYVALLEANNDSLKSVATKAVKHVNAYSDAISLVMDKIVIRDNNNSPIILLLFKEDSATTSHNKSSSSVTPLITFDRIIGDSPVMRNVKKVARKAAHSLFSVLILGGSGTGKDMIAQSIHSESKRSGAFIALNCGAVPKDLLHSELFGYVEGAFTGAKKGGNVGKIVLAEKGTLFLDEVGEMPLNMQVSLLRFLQDKIVTPVGSSHSQIVDVRIIAATNSNLYEEMKRGNFREDLYYRLNVIQITMPSLSQHREDIPSLVKYMLNEMSRQFNTDPICIDEKALNALTNYNWPGNVRELKNILESSLLFAENNLITLNSLPSLLKDSFAANMFMPKGSTNNYEKTTIIEVLQKYAGNITKASTELGITRPTLYSKIRTMDINIDEIRHKQLI